MSGAAGASYKAGGLTELNLPGTLSHTMLLWARVADIGAFFQRDR